MSKVFKILISLALPLTAVFAQEAATKETAAPATSRSASAEASLQPSVAPRGFPGGAAQSDGNPQGFAPRRFMPRPADASASPAGASALPAAPQAPEGAAPLSAAAATPLKPATAAELEDIISTQKVTQPSAQTSKNPDEDLQGPFYFVDESPIQVIRILEVLTGKTILQTATLPNVKINFATKGKMPRKEAVLAFESLLSINGIAMVPMGDKFIKAVPSAGVNTQSPEFLLIKPSELPVNLNFYSKLFELQYMDIETIEPKLQPFLSPAGVSAITIFPRSNAVLITDTLSNLQRVELLISKLDLPAQVREDIAFVQLKNMAAEDMKTRLTNIQSELMKKYFEKTIIDVDARTNQVIILTQKGNMPYVMKVIEGLDIPAEPLLKSSVHYIKHGEAKEIVKVVQEIVTGQQQAAKSTKNTKPNSAKNTTANNASANSAANQTAQAAASSQKKNSSRSDGESTGMEFSEYVTVVSDEWSNAIVAYGTPTDLAQIASIIEKIDVQLLQVKIDVIITEVTLTDNQVSGLSTFGLGYNLSGDWPQIGSGFAGNTSTYTLGTGSETAFSLSANQDSFSAVFNVAQENQNVKVLSSPSIVTSHNNEAYITVGEAYPIITSSTSDIINPETTQSSVTYQNIGIELKVTPRIGDNGIVQMQIKQVVDTVVRYTTIDNNEQPVIGKREAESFVSVNTGETIVMGGLQQVDASDKEGKVWLLGDLPLIGHMFNPKSSSTIRRELVIFIRPTIIKSTKVADLLAGESLKNSYVGTEVRDYFEDGKFYSRADVQMREKTFEDDRFYNKLWRAPWCLILPPQKDYTPEEVSQGPHDDASAHPSQTAAGAQTSASKADTQASAGAKRKSGSPSKRN